jgi:starch phosphorylase
VQAIHGRAGADDRLTDPVVEELRLEEDYTGGRYRYEGRIPLDRAGPFGYTVRIVPRHKGLISCAEMGLLAEPPTSEAWTQAGAGRR